VSRRGPEVEPEVHLPGVRSLDHTADVGIEVHASDLEELFRRAALGSLWMAVGDEGWGGGAPGQGRETLEERTLLLEETDLAALLRSWCRELLYWQEVEGFLAQEIPELEIAGAEPDPVRLRARIRGRDAPSHPVREIKGVTWHGLRVEASGEGWGARVIFDV
jgi:SHS2 domain-containing protein